MLRWLNFVLCLAMLVLAVVAALAHRPVWWLWTGYFVVPAFWAFVAGFRHRTFRSVQWLGWLWACIAGWGVLLWQYWPQTPGFWRQQVWQHDTAARDGVSLAAALAALAVALFTAYRKR
jgi:hypothetical protein